jgi:GTPase SAR1 family protein
MLGDSGVGKTSLGACVHDIFIIHQKHALHK